VRVLGLGVGGSPATEIEAAGRGRFEGTAGVGSSPAPKTEKEAARVGTRGREKEERGRRGKESGGCAGGGGRRQGRRVLGTGAGEKEERDRGGGWVRARGGRR
jgi:hypothetical protein